MSNAVRARGQSLGPLTGRRLAPPAVAGRAAEGVKRAVEFNAWRPGGAAQALAPVLIGSASAGIRVSGSASTQLGQVTPRLVVALPAISILDATTRAACLAASSQQAQLEALITPFGTSNVTARLFTSAGVHLRTLTLPALTIDATTPRQITLGAHLADAAIATGTPGYWILRTASGTDVLRLSAGAAGSNVVTHVGDVKTLCTPTLAGVTVIADLALTAESAPPYALPPAGEAKQIAASGAHLAVNPGVHSSNNFTYSTFGSYGSGVFNPHWSARGAYMIAGTGGHNHPETFGCVYIDFQTGAWGYIAAVGQADRGPVDETTETNGAPWYEMTGTQIPAPPHPYSNLTVLPPALGGSTKGSLMYVTRFAVGVGARGALSAHRFDLPGGVWSRAAAAAATAGGTPIFDPTTNRWYTVGGDLWSVNKLYYLRASDFTWQEVTGVGFSYATCDANLGQNAFRHGRLIVVHQGNAAGTAGRFQAIDLDNPTAGWSTLTVTGQTQDANYANGWVFHEAQGVYYRRYADRAGGGTLIPQGQTIYKLTPPASSPLTNTWTITSVSLTGDTVPEYSGADVGTQAFNSLMYVPAIQMLGWVTGFGVALLNPT